MYASKGGYVPEIHMASNKPATPAKKKPGVGKKKKGGKSKKGGRSKRNNATKKNRTRRVYH